jgi:Universal stress protein family
MTMPTVFRIVVGVSESPGSVPALRHAVGLARQHDAVLIPVHAWVPPGGDLDERKHPSLQLRQLWEDDAWQRLWDTLDTAFGGLPAGVRAEPVVLRGKPGRVLTGVARLVPHSTGPRRHHIPPLRSGLALPHATPNRQAVSASGQVLG